MQNENIKQIQAFGFQDYLSIFLIYRRTFLLGFLAVFLGIVIHTFTARPVYEATATLHLSDTRTQGSRLEEMLLNKQNPIETEMEMLKSRTNMEETMRKLHLDWDVSKKSEGVSFKLLDFASSTKEPNYVIKLTGSDTYKVFDHDNVLVGEGKSGVLTQGKEIRLLISDLIGKPGDSFRLTLLNFFATAQGLQKLVKVSEVGKKTNIMKVSYQNNDPQRAIDFVNTLSVVYLERNRGLKTQEAARAVQFLNEQLNVVRGDLNTSEKKLQEYKSSAGTFELGSEARELITRISGTEKERREVIFQKKQIEFSLASLNKSKKEKKIYSPALLKDEPLIGGMAAKLADLETQKQGLLSEYTENHPAVRVLQEQVDELHRKIQSTYENALNNLSKAEETLNQTLSQYESNIKKMPAVEREHAKLFRDSKVSADIYTFLLQKSAESSISAASTVGNIDIIDPAILPQAPVTPQKKKNIILALLMGCMAGLGLVFLRNRLDDTIKDSGAAKLTLGMPLLAVIPHISGAAEDGQGKSLVVFKEPKASASEAFRSLRTAVHFSAVTRAKQIILITSTFPSEGKSTIIANLSITMAQIGARVLIMDCDLRKPSLHDIFGHSKEPGLSEILAGDSEFDKVIHNTNIPGLDFVSAGTTPPNPSELIGSAQMSKLLESLKARYDHILLDAPPVLAVTDAPFLAASVHMVVLVVESGRVPVKAASRMREMLEGINAPLAGFVFNNKTEVSEHYGYGYGYGYGYDHYGEEPEDKKHKSWWKRFLKSKK